MGRARRAVERAADAAAAAGRKHTAGDYYLRAGNYYYNAERFILPGEEKREWGRKAYRCYHTGIRLRHPNIEFVEVPYEGTTLPALFMKAPVAGPAPTVVIVNGMDNAKEMSIFFAGLEFARRGFHTLAMDGPGQGESLRMRGIHSRYDYEVPGAAAFDYVAAPQRGRSQARRHHGLQLRRLLFLPHRRLREALCGLHRALRAALGPGRLAAADQGEEQERSRIGRAIELPVPMGGRTPPTPDEAIEIAQKILAQGRGAEHHLPVPGHPRRQRPRGAVRERPEAL